MGLELKYWPQTSQGAQPTLQVNLWFAGMEKDPLNSSTHTPIKKINQKPTCSAPPSAKQIDTFSTDGERDQMIWEYVKRRWGKNSPYWPNCCKINV